MKKKILLVVLSAFLLLGALAVGVGAADESEPSLAIKSGQLAFENTIYLQYAVEATNVSSYDKVKLLVWLTPQSEYVNNGTQDYTLDCAYTFTSGGKTRARYIIDDLAAAKMTVDVYTVAYYEKDGNEYYSPLIKYSILQYVYNKLGYTGSNPSTDENYKSLLENLLEYGAAAQKYFGENLTRPANTPFYEISVNNGLITDGTAKGLYREGEKIVLVANPASNGQKFTHWTNSAGASVGTEERLEVEMGSKAETYTANYLTSHAVTVVNGKLSDGSITGAFYAGDSLTLVANSVENKKFSHWTNAAGETVGATAALTITMGDAAETYTANYISPNTVTVVNGKLSDGSAIGSFYEGDSLALVANSVENKKFTHWTNAAGETVGTTATLTLTMGNAAETYTANYASTSTIAVVNGTLSDGSTTGTFFIGDSFTLVASAIENKKFTHWTNAAGETVGTTETLTLVAGISEETYTANYVSPVTITVKNGSIIGAFSPATFYPGDVIEIVVRGANSTTKKFVNWTNSAGEVIGTETSMYIEVGDTSETYTANFVKLSSVTVVNGTLSDGATVGSFFEGDSFTLVAYESGETQIFSNWTDSSGNVVGSTASLTLTMGAAAETYTANYTSTATPDSYFVFTEITDGDGNVVAYSIAPASMSDLPEELIFPSTYNGKPVTTIGANAFSSATTVKTILIPASYTQIGSRAFLRCSNLTTVTLRATISMIEANAFPKSASIVYNCDSAAMPAGWASSWASVSSTINWGCNNVTSNDTFDYVVYGNKAYITAYKGTALSVEVPEEIDGYTVVSITSAFDSSATTEELILPDTIELMNANSFAKATSLRLIYSYSADQPTGWDSDWNSTSVAIYFGYTGTPVTLTLTLDDEQGTGTVEEITIAFGSVYTLPELQLYGHIFLGWYDGDTEVTGGIWGYTTDKTLVAKWEFAIDEDGVLTPEDTWD